MKLTAEELLFCLTVVIIQFLVGFNVWLTAHEVGYKHGYVSAMYDVQQGADPDTYFKERHE